MIKLVTDSTSDIDESYAKELNIDVVPLKVIIDDKEYRDRVDLNPGDFYNLLKESKNLPTTSQPSPQEFLEFYLKAKEKGDTVIVLTLSSKVSGTYQSANIAKDLSEYEDIHIIDTLSATQGLRLIVLKTLDLINEGMPINEIVDYIEQYKHRVKIVAYVDTLEYFVKGGRLSKTAGTAGTLLKLKPLICLENGGLNSFSKARGMKKATQKIIDYINDNGGIDLNERIAIGYTGDDSDLDKFEDVLKAEFNFENVLYGFVGPVIGTHAGPGARVISYTSKE